jgi:hypothetical protein
MVEVWYATLTKSEKPPARITKVHAAAITTLKQLLLELTLFLISGR